MTLRLAQRPRRGHFVPLFLLPLGPACGGETHIRLLEPASERASPDGGGAGAQPSVDDLRGAACGRWTAEREPEQALLMLIVDVSGSMATPLRGTNASRWEVERPILARSVATLPPSVGVGVLFYPNMATPVNGSPLPSYACVDTDWGIPVGMLGSPDSRHRVGIERALEHTEPDPQAGTPTLDAYLIGLEALGRTTLAGSRQMLLITDGQPTYAEGCVGTGAVDDPVDPGPIVATVAAARRAGIKTFVIGSPGSDEDDARPWLSAAAEQGGTAADGCSHSGPNYCHFDMVSELDFGRGLEAALGDISSRIARCDFQLPDPPADESIDPDAVNVVFTAPDGLDVLLARNDSPACTEGWQLSEDGERVILCPRTCERVRGALGAKLEFLFGCDSVAR